MHFITTPHEAEINAERVLRGWGYTDAKATSGGADGGIDVRSSRAFAQVKWRGGLVGRPDLQRLYGARGTDTTKRLCFFTASGFTPQAVAYAKQVGIGLYVYDPLGTVTAINSVMSVATTHGDRTGSYLDRLWLVAIVVAAIAGLAFLTLVSNQLDGIWRLDRLSYHF